MRANILTIGTEITSGEIVNGNAAWVAQRLEEKGYRVLEHLSIPDEADLMLAALEQLPKAEVLVVTGGLGPTSDDRTREVLARWWKKPLQFLDNIWRELNDLYDRRGLPIREAHRHQCFFPKDSTVLKNPVGTAHGFCFSNNGTAVYVLPGPPRELEGMWMSGVEPILPPGQELPWRHWTCLGMPESEVAEKIEPLIHGLTVEVGYRATVPYVHLKLRGLQCSTQLAELVEKALGNAIVGRNKHDFLEEFLASLGDGEEVLLQDQVSRGFLAARLTPHLRHLPNLRLRIEECWKVTPNAVAKDCRCGQLLLTEDPVGFDVVWTDRARVRRTSIRLPYQTMIASERGAKSAAELALFNWWSWFKASD